MRALLLLLAVPGVAAADGFHPTSWDEVGVVRTRISMGDGHAVDGFAVRFAPHVPLRHNLYLGAELDAGHLTGDIATPAVFRTTGGEMGPTSAVQGTFGAVRVVLGMRGRAGIISAGAELAAGFHRAELQDANGLEVAVVEATSTMIEGRGRLDLWLTPKLTIGGIAAVDLGQPRDVSAGLMLGFHFGDYDGMR